MMKFCHSFLSTHTDILVDNSAKNATYSLMDGFSSYNQVRIEKKDKENTTFVKHWGTFCYKVMSFELKNTRVTYQRAIITLFHNMMHREVKVYVDDILTKSKKEKDHV